jgi:acetyl esterase/lipase
MNPIDRRDFLALGSALFAAQAAAQQASVQPQLSPPPPPQRMPQSWTKAESIDLWNGEPPGASQFKPQELPKDWTPVFLRNISKPDLRVFRPARPTGQALLVLPGGAYWFVSAANEGVQLAERMTSLGVTVFVLTYRLPGEGWSPRAAVPLQDAQRAMRMIRANARRYGIDATSVSVLGFSAGGHLAATLATQHAEQAYATKDATDRLSPRPFAAALIYPVVTMKTPWTHELSRKLLLGETPSVADVDRRSAELHVDPTTPPTFIVHAMDDAAVPVENSLRMMEALRAAKRPVEAHLLQEGGHAFGTGFSNTPSERWIDLFNAWMNRLTARTASA